MSLKLKILFAPHSLTACGRHDKNGELHIVSQGWSCMANERQASLSALNSKMVAVSLVIAIMAAGGLMVAGDGGIPAIAAVVVTALFSSLACARIFARGVAAARLEQLAMVEKLGLSGELSGYVEENDDLRSLLSRSGFIMEVLDARLREHRQLLAQIVAAEENLKVVMHSLSISDEKELVQVRNAVTAMESMDGAFATVIGDIDELSGRSAEQETLSTKMSTTTDGIADNINQYSDFVIETSSSIEQMVRAIREIAENIRGLSASTEETVSSINQISVSQAKVRNNAERGALASENVREQAQSGLRNMAATLRAMQEIEKSNVESFDAINRLSRHSARVGEFLNVIQEVVEQTKLLSLNASIIAAQAGVRGRAFAVVAEEVRSLASRTSASTREIEELVRNIQKETAAVQRSVTQGKDKVKEGVKISSLANEALVKIEKSADEASHMVARIAAEAAEQTVGIQRITEEAEKNLERVQQITQSTENQQDGANLIVRNLEHMRDLAHRINMTAQEQAKENRLYLQGVIEHNERTKGLKENVYRQLVVAENAVEAVCKVDDMISANTVETRKILGAVTVLTRVIDLHRGETGAEAGEGEEAIRYE
ncbi:methyl-accepting chemotaxis protein [Oryzomonas japonica]|uniref:Methyl-accepting chemotaxis protein n=2 Tax=Oryzomonas japonica TaxID=2603858 RepID=A0A7J4ZV92_9BACT|nr:methyl-accepting chemotaxis protein [Oryzomonas japonica]